MSTPTINKHTFQFQGKTIEATVARQADQVTQWLAENVTETEDQSTRLLVGLDVKSKRSSNVASESSNETNSESSKAALLQLYMENHKCLIIQLVHMDSFPSSLESVLLNRKFVFIGYDIKTHLEKLREYGLQCAFTIDMHDLANDKLQKRTERQIEHMQFVDKIAGLIKQDVDGIGEWDDENLNVMQIESAACDAYATLRNAEMLLKLVWD